MTGPYFEIAIGLICRQNRILISKRKADTFLGGYWEFPGGKIKKGEDQKAALKREIKEELALDVLVDEKFRELEFTYPDRSLRFHIYWCEPCDSDEPRALEVADFRWVRFDQLHGFEFPAANREILDALSRFAVNDKRNGAS